MGALKKALSYYLQAIAIREENPESNQPELAGNYQGIAVNYRKMNELPEALRYQQKAIKIIESIYPEDHPYRQKASHTLNELLEAIKKDKQ